MRPKELYKTASDIGYGSYSAAVSTLTPHRISVAFPPHDTVWTDVRSTMDGHKRDPRLINLSHHVMIFKLAGL